MKALTRIVTIGMFVFPVIAQAQTEPPNPPAAPATDAKPATAAEVICVDQEVITGSRFRPPRICHTKEEWDKLGAAKR